MFLPPTVNAMLSGRNLAPLHSWHGRIVMYCSISLRTHSDCTSRKRRSRLGITPSKCASKCRVRPRLLVYSKVISSSPRPYRRMFCCSTLSSPIGASGSMPYVSPTPLKTPHNHLLELFAHGTMPPSEMDRRKSSTFCGSTSIRLPKPLHVGQAPYGLLNENK